MNLCWINCGTSLLDQLRYISIPKPLSAHNRSQNNCSTLPSFILIFTSPFLDHPSTFITHITSYTYHPHHTNTIHTTPRIIHTNKTRLAKLIHIQPRRLQLVVDEQPVAQIETLSRVRVAVEVGENERNVLAKQNHMNLCGSPPLLFPHNCSPLLPDTGPVRKSRSAPHDQSRTQCRTPLGSRKCRPP